MSIEIDCPECGGKGISPRYNLDTDSFHDLPCPLRDCHNGKITVYTHSELQVAVKEAIEKEREAMKCCGNCKHNEYDAGIGDCALSSGMYYDVCDNNWELRTDTINQQPLRLP